MNYEPFLQVALTKGIGDVTLKKIMVSNQKNSSFSWFDLCNDEHLLRNFSMFKNETILSIGRQKDAAKRLAEKLYRNDVKIILYSDDIFPEKLKRSLGEKCPAFLFYKGNLGILNKKSVGFCGSRKVSQKGLNITSDCAKQLVEKDIVVVSGYAAGTDLAAHKAALLNSGETVFVLAEGILKASYKSEIKEHLTSTNHVFISQFMPELTWKARNAMKRNSTIIGLSDAMILVESGKNGGTFSAGNEALSLHHPLFVIDFAQPEVSAEANPYFIEHGGIPIRGSKSGIPNLEKVFSVIENKSTIKRTNQSDFKQLKLNF